MFNTPEALWMKLLTEIGLSKIFLICGIRYLPTLDQHSKACNVSNTYAATLVLTIFPSPNNMMIN